MAAKMPLSIVARCCRTQLARPRSSLPHTSFRSIIPATASRYHITPSSRRPFAVSCAVREKKYTEDHEWIELDSDGETGTIGISVYAANALGDVVYVELPTPDTSVAAGDTIGAVESVKSASDILTPVSGTILEGNSLLEEKPGTINKGPEGEGWIAKIKVEDKAEVDKLMNLEAYRKFTEE